MKTAHLASGVALIGLAVGLPVALAARSAAAGPDPSASCIKVRAEARYRALGYNHIVHVADVCAAPAECDVSTDVNPQAVHVSVPGKTEVEVTTFLGSPARVFTPKVDCKMQGL
jgi:hypothetical protein